MFTRFEAGESWAVLSPIEQSIKRKIEAAGKPLREWDVKIYRGILTGCNEAFIINGVKKAELIAQDPRSAEIIRPILRGRDIKRYGYDFADLWVIATFPSRHYDIDQYPAVKRHLLTFGIERLEQTGKTYTIDGKTVKARKKTNNKWFETQDSIGYWEDFNKQKLVWPRLMRIAKSDLNNFPRFTIVDSKFYVSDSTCFLVGDELMLLCDLLNSPLSVYYFLRNVAVLDNGGLQMRQQFIENVPLIKGDPFIGTSDSYSFSSEERLFICNFIADHKSAL